MIVIERTYRLASRASALFLLSGCAVGPDFHTPAMPNVSSFLPRLMPTGRPQIR